MHQANKKLLREKHWALLDVEFIRISLTHGCIRKLYILHDKQHIHKLSYNPKFYSPECLLTLPILSKFIVCNGIELILYKGGTIKKDMCEALDMPSQDIECFEELVKAHSHDPKFEVNFNYDQIRNFVL